MALASWLATGSMIDLGTDGRAARWITEPAPGRASSRAASSRIEPSTRSAPTPSRLVAAAGGEVVEGDDVVAPAGQLPAQVGADEPGPAGDDDPHDLQASRTISITRSWSTECMFRPLGRQRRVAKRKSRAISRTCPPAPGARRPGWARPSAICTSGAQPRRACGPVDASRRCGRRRRAAAAGGRSATGAPRHVAGEVEQVGHRDLAAAGDVHHGAGGDVGGGGGEVGGHGVVDVGEVADRRAVAVEREGACRREPASMRRWKAMSGRCRGP